MAAYNAFGKPNPSAPTTVRPLVPPIEREAEFETAFTEHYTRVYGVLFRLLGDRAQAEDLAVEAFWRLWERAPQQRENLGGWLYRVAMRLGYNALRAARRRERYELQAGREALALATSPEPSRALEEKQERARVRATLANLKERDAQLLILRHSGFSYREIADTLGIAPGSVGTLLARAEAEFEKRYTP